MEIEHAEQTCFLFLTQLTDLSLHVIYAAHGFFSSHLLPNGLIA